MKHLEVEILDPDKLIKVNNLKEITNPVFFKRDNIPTDDGLLSNIVFGITKYDRANTFAYINLNEYFINPLIYKKMISLNRKIKDIINGTNMFKITSDGEIVEDPNGETGLKWFMENYDRVKFKSTDSNRRDKNILFLKKHRNLVFMNKLIVIPAYYRDVNSSDGRVGVGDINKLYNNILLSVRSIKETADYGLNISDSIRGRLQDTIIAIYDWFSDEPNLSSKMGIIKRAVQSKTADYASRLIITSPDIDAETIDDMYVNLDYTGVPLSSLCANLYPFMIFNVKRFFENEFSTGKYPYMTKDGKVAYVTVKNPQLEFSDERIKTELDRFIKGFSNRFIPIQVPNEEGKKIYMKFKGREVSINNLKDADDTGIINRRLTWCDVFFMAAVESSKFKHVLITRYPLNSYSGQFPTKIRVLSTKDTEVVIINGEKYPKYPKIREEDIEKNTANKFIDTLQMSNLYLNAIGGDYDGDQVTAKVAYLEESNKELDEFMNSNMHYIDLSGINCRNSTNEAIQAIYSLTRVIDNSKLVDFVF